MKTVTSIVFACLFIFSSAIAESAPNYDICTCNGSIRSFWTYIDDLDNTKIYVDRRITNIEPQQPNTNCNYYPNSSTNSRANDINCSLEGWNKSIGQGNIEAIYGINMGNTSSISQVNALLNNGRFDIFLAPDSIFNNIAGNPQGYLQYNMITITDNGPLTNSECCNLQPGSTGHLKRASVGADIIINQTNFSFYDFGPVHPREVISEDGCEPNEMRTSSAFTTCAFREVMQHEIGHILGLDEENTQGVADTMSNRTISGGWYEFDKRTTDPIQWKGLFLPGPEALEELQLLYENSANYQDVAVKSFIAQVTPNPPIFGQPTVTEVVPSTLPTGGLICHSSSDPIRTQFTLDNRGSLNRFTRLKYFITKSPSFNIFSPHKEVFPVDTNGNALPIWYSIEFATSRTSEYIDRDIKFEPIDAIPNPQEEHFLIIIADPDNDISEYPDWESPAFSPQGNNVIVMEPSFYFTNNPAVCN